MNQPLEQWRLRLTNTVARWNSSLRRFFILRLALDAVEAFNADRLPLLAASLSYYALLALFPLLLLIIAVGSLFAAERDLTQSLGRSVAQLMPGAADEIERILREAVDARGPATVIGVLALFWSASGLFDVLQTALDRAWRVHLSRAFWQQRLISLLVILGLILLFLASLLLSALTDDVVRGALGLGAKTLAWVGRAVSVVAVFAALLILYKFFPHARVSWRAALVGAIVAAVLWELAKNFYGIYLISFARFNLVYGSVGAMIGLLLWGYISASIILFGGEISATLERDTAAAQER